MPNSIEHCPICKRGASLRAEGLNLSVNCAYCGSYVITASACSILNGQPLDARQAANASGWVAETRPPMIESGHLAHIRVLAAPSVQSRLDSLLLRLAKDSPVLGVHVTLDELHAPAYVSATYSINEGELRFLVESMHRQDLLGLEHSNWIMPKLTHASYAYIDARLRKNAESPIGFCAMWFSPEVLSLWEQAIEPAIGDAGFEPMRLDKYEHNNRIDDEIIASIRRARFLVADLTAHRAGVYFEAGFAMGLGLPVVWMVRKDALGDTHFDNRQFNFIVWAPEKLDEARSALRNRIEATIGRGPRPPRST